MPSIFDQFKKIAFYLWRIWPGLLDALSPSYHEILDTYQNLQQVTIALKNMSFGSANGYDTALSVLGGSYSPTEDWATLQALFDQQFPTNTIYEKIFLVRTIHILWMEKHGWLPWTIKDYSKDEINALFYEERVNYLDSSLGPKPSINYPSQYVGSEEYADPQLELEASYKLHELAIKMEANTVELSVTNAVRWIKTNFFHAYNSWGFDRYKGKPDPWVIAPGNFLPSNMESLFDERIVGCHEPVMLLSEILRCLNIPAVNLNIFSHGVTYIPSLDSYVHGDHLANRPLVPVSLMLLTKDEIVQYSDEDDMLFNLLDNKIKSVFDPTFASLFSNNHIGRVDNTLILPIDGMISAVPANIVDAFRTEAQQYNIQYDAVTGKFTSQPVPIQSLVSLST
jgi:hypothetical protein